MRRPWRAVCTEACTRLFEDVPWRAIAAFYTMTTASMSTMRANAVTGAKRSEVSPELLRAADVGLNLEYVQRADRKVCGGGRQPRIEPWRHLMRQTRAFLVLASVSVLLPTSLIAAEATDRTTMPDYCSQRDVNCVLLDGPSRVMAAPRAADPSGINTVITLPSGTASPGTFSGTLAPSVPTLTGQAVPVPSLTTGTSPSSATSGASSSSAGVPAASGGPASKR